MHRYSPGEPMLFREIWSGKVWGAYPAIVIQDTPELLAVYRHPDTIARRHISARGDRPTAEEIRQGKWLLNAVSRNDFWMLRMAIPGETYSVIIFFRTADNSVIAWYVNLEGVARRGPLGIDYTDLMLDVVIEPDLKEWRWVDEDELREAVEAGLIPPDKVDGLYAKGAEARDLIMSGKSVFNGWEHWRPDPSSKAPVLPERWDEVAKSKVRAPKSKAQVKTDN